MTLKQYIENNSYPGRGIFAGLDDTGTKAVLAYFITGRSENSRNRLLVADGEGAVTKAFDESKVVDPSLIIYAAVRECDGKTVVTNGDQTDTIVSFLGKGQTFDDALQTRAEEPDAPHFTPRISVIADTENKLSARFAILRRQNGQTARDFFTYTLDKPGEGRLLHTYEGEGDPLPTFAGAPRQMAFTAESIAADVWEALGAERRVALWVRTVELATGVKRTQICNRHEVLK